MPRGNQLTRQWKLLQLVDRQAGVVVDDAARDLDCAVRTIWRDLQVLQAAGFPVYDEPMADGRRSVWRVEDSFKRRLPLKLTLAELAALLMSRDVLGPAGAGVLGPAITSSFEKIASIQSQISPEEMQKQQDSLTKGIFTLDMFRQQFQMIAKIGMKDMIGRMPGMCSA